jgi:hypothetical protein
MDCASRKYSQWHDDRANPVTVKLAMWAWKNRCKSTVDGFV